VGVVKKRCVLPVLRATPYFTDRGYLAADDALGEPIIFDRNYVFRMACMTVIGGLLIFALQYLHPDDGK
jgi:hypothetical protein